MKINLKDSRKLFVLLGIFLWLFIISTLPQNNNNISVSENNLNRNLKISGYWTLDNITIDDSLTGLDAHNWTWARSQSWCTKGDGTWGNPYIIENVTIFSDHSGPCIDIENSQAYFIVRNSTLGTNGMTNVVAFTDVSNGTLFNNTIYGSENAYGIDILRGSNNTITYNTIRNNYNGLNLDQSDNNTISYNLFKDQSSYSISGHYSGSDGSDNNTIIRNLITGSSGGITFSYGYDNIIKNNNITNLDSASANAMYFYQQGRHQIVGNLLENILGGGISIKYIEYINISQNTFTNIGGRGLYSQYCQFITMKDNIMTGAGVDMIKFSTSSPIEEINSHDIDTSNKINGKTLYYYKNVNNLRNSDFLDAGQIILVNCNDSIISNHDLSNGTQSITLFLSHNNTLDNINASENNRYGVYLWESANNTIKESQINNNDPAGIYTLRGGFNNFSYNDIINNSKNGIELSTDSPNCTVSGNFIKGGSENGIEILDDNQTITFNNITDFGWNGIYTGTGAHYFEIIGNLISDSGQVGLYSQGDNYLILNNTIINNGIVGIRLGSVENYTLKYNNLTYDGIWMTGINQYLTSHSIDTTNTVNNKPIYYYKNTKNLGASNFINAGQIILVFCNDSIISDQDLSYGTVGVSLYDCINITIDHNNVSNSDNGGNYGIYLIRSTFCNISNNNVNGTDQYGIYLSSSSENNTIDNNDVSTSKQDGIYLYKAHNTTILNNLVYKNGRYGIAISQTDNCTIVKNNCYNNTERGIYTSGGSDYTEIIGNNFTNNLEYGMYIWGGKNNTIAFNNLSANQKYGIYLDSTLDINISKNILEDNAEYGLYLDENDNPMIFLNNFSRCGIGFYGSLGEITSTITDQSNKINGKILYIYNSMDYLKPNDFINAGEIVLIQINHSVISNLEFGESSVGIYLFYSHNNTFTNVNISNELKYGVFGASSDFNNFTGCTIGYNTEGIYINRCNNTNIFYNNIINNINHGIWNEDSINTTISSNDISNNGVNGIKFYGIKNATVLNNTIKSNNNIGLSVDVSSESNLIYLNNFIGNLHHASDDGLYNKWDNGTIGNFWDNLTDKDADDDGIADNLIYNIPGSANENDTKPIYWDAPVLTINLPLSGEYESAPGFNIQIDEGINHTIWYSILEAPSGKNYTIDKAFGQINSTLWDDAPSGELTLRFYVNDSKGFQSFTDVKITKITSDKKNGGGDDTSPDGTTFSLQDSLIFIVIGVVVAGTITGLLVSKRSKKQLKEKDREIDELKKQKEEITEDDIKISKERHICLVHKGPVEGLSFICPQCGAYYCVKCYEAIKKEENECWSCGVSLDASKAKKTIKEKEEEKPKIEMSKETHKKPKAEKSVPVPEAKKEIEFEDEKAKLTIREAPIKKEKAIPEKKIEEFTPAPPKPIEKTPVIAPSIEKLEKIAKFEEAIEKINIAIQKLDIQFSAGALSQEDYLAKKNYLGEKLGEAMLRLEQLKE